MSLCIPLIRYLLNRRQVVPAVSARLVPFFFMRHPERGDRLGPYVKLPVNSTVRRLALDVAVTSFIIAGVDDSLREAVEKAVTGTAESSYWEQQCTRL